MVDKVVERIIQEGYDQEDLHIGSLDAEALYPILVFEKIAGLVASKTVDSGLKFEGVDWAWAIKFVALALEEDEVRKKGLQDIIPKKRPKSSKKPTLRTVEEDDKRERWKYPRS